MVYEAVKCEINGQTSLYTDGGTLDQYPVHCFDGTSTVNCPRVVFTNMPNLSPILVIKFMTFVLVKTGPNVVITKHVLARTIFLILS